MEKFRPLPEPIRLKDLLNSARSRTKKKLRGLPFIYLLLPFTSWSVHLCIPELIPSGLLMSYQAASLYCGDMPEWVKNKFDQLPQQLPVKQ